MAVKLDASKGPLGTRNYHVALELIALEGEQSFMHIEYSYSEGLLARLAMRLYFATSGSAKVGFTWAVDGEPPHLIGGVRGALERNTMRYYLALEAFLASRDSGPSAFRRKSRALVRGYGALSRQLTK